MAIYVEEERIWVTDLEDPELRLICQHIDPHQKVKKKKPSQSSFISGEEEEGQEKYYWHQGFFSSSRSGLVSVISLESRKEVFYLKAFFYSIIRKPFSLIIPTQKK